MSLFVGSGALLSELSGYFLHRFTTDFILHGGSEGWRCAAKPRSDS
jgi:hypothetical protein